MKIILSENSAQLGARAAALTAKKLNEAIAAKGCARLVMSTGASQFDTIAALVKEDVDWSRVDVYHLDEYVDLGADHPASFRKYIKERFADIVCPRSVNYVIPEGDIAANIAALTDSLRSAPVDCALIGIGENGHIAFNDPPADFDTEQAYIIVNLDDKCRHQQLGEGWFATIDDVPRQAVSMTVREILKAKTIISAVPYAVKAQAIKATLENELTPRVPATALKGHPDFYLFIDRDSAALTDIKE